MTENINLDEMLKRINNLENQVKVINKKLLDYQILKPKEDEVLKAITERFSHLKNIEHIYLTVDDNIYDLMFIIKDMSFRNKMDISTVITDLMRSYKNIYFDALIFSESEIEDIEIDDGYIKLR